MQWLLAHLLYATNERVASGHNLTLCCAAGVVADSLLQAGAAVAHLGHINAADRCLGGFLALRLWELHLRSWLQRLSTRDEALTSSVHDDAHTYAREDAAEHAHAHAVPTAEAVLTAAEELLKLMRPICNNTSSNSNSSNSNNNNNKGDATQNHHQTEQTAQHQHAVLQGPLHIIQTGSVSGSDERYNHHASTWPQVQDKWLLDCLFHPYSDAEHSTTETSSLSDRAAGFDDDDTQTSENGSPLAVELPRLRALQVHEALIQALRVAIKPSQSARVADMAPSIVLQLFLQAGFSLCFCCSGCSACAPRVDLIHEHL